MAHLAKSRSRGERVYASADLDLPEIKEHVQFVPDANPGSAEDEQDFRALTQAIGQAIAVDSIAAQSDGHALSGRLRATAAGQTATLAPSDVPHYFAKTTTRPNYLYRFLYALSIVASLIYIGVRVYYIASGRSSLRIPRNVLGNQAVIQDLRDGFTYSYAWSTVVLLAEIGGFILVHVGQQMFTRQDTTFEPMTEAAVQKLRQIVKKHGALQRINIMVCTYSEPMETVQSCVQALLDAPVPVYAQKVIYVGDDGAKKAFPVSAQKMRMCEKFRSRGYNVIWVGDRKALPGQLNGKSSNINHMVLNRMYPHAERTRDIPFRDILMVMDCDHMVEPQFFAKCCAVMLDKKVAVCLVPQSFHNEARPDCFDNTNYNFMFRLMPYYFGAGCCFVTGTNVMIRARAAFEACRFDENPHAAESAALAGDVEAGNKHRQLFSETLVAEDIDLGSRVHCLGYKSVFLCEVLAKGEVPRDGRDIWKQRSRWAKAAHLYILDKDSVFWRKQPHMSYWQKSLYWIPMVLHFTIIWSEPIMFTMPILCIVGDICPYGIDVVLWATHFFKLVTTLLVSTYADTWELSRSALYAQTASRVLFFVNVKAVLNTLMIYSGWKKPGAFKVTAKAGTKPAASVKPVNAVDGPQPADSIKLTTPAERQTLAELDTAPRFALHRVHDKLSDITEKRGKCMPFEGTLDFWVLLLITLMNLFTVCYGLNHLEGKFFSLRGTERDNVQLIALVFAFVEATPGLLFIWYLAVQGRRYFEWTLKVWVPLVIGTISILCTLIEARVGFQYVVTVLGLNWQLPRCEIGNCAIKV